MVFQKGSFYPHKENCTCPRCGGVPWHKGKKTGLIPKSAFKKGNPSWNKGKGIENKCIDCGKKVSYYTKRCRECNTKWLIPWQKGKKIPQISGDKNVNWKGGLPKCINCGKELSNYRLRKLCRECWNKSDELKKQGTRSYINQNHSKNPTSIEVKLYEELKNRGLLFETQKLINNKFVVDAYIPSLNLVVEADGDYWHSLPKSISRDKSKNAYLKTCGYKLLRLTGTEINNGEFRNKLQEVLN
ncbi:MAG: DUF559 domain-containing protein [Candidatus Beckwithbacteria bacterium]